MSIKKVSFVSADNKLVNLEIEVKSKQCNATDWETLKDVEHPQTLSITGECGCGCGQIYDDFVPTKAQQKLVDFWREYHLNDMCAGTKAQMGLLKENNVPTDYDTECKFLEEHNLLTDRGYKFGCGWLYKSFPQDELNCIIDNVIKEEMERVDSKDNVDIDLFEDSEELFDFVMDKLGCTDSEANMVVAFMRSENIDLEEIDEISIDENKLTYYSTDYYVGTEDELTDIAHDYLDRDLWVEAVNADSTDLGFEDWVDEVISMDGVGSVLNSWDGTSNEECVNNVYYTICRA